MENAQGMLTAGVLALVILAGMALVVALIGMEDRRARGRHERESKR